MTDAKSISGFQADFERRPHHSNVISCWEHIIHQRALLDGDLSYMLRLSVIAFSAQTMQLGYYPIWVVDARLGFIRCSTLVCIGKAKCLG